MADQWNVSKEHSCNVTAKTAVFGEYPLPVSVWPHKYHMDDPAIIINVKVGGTYSYHFKGFSRYGVSASRIKCGHWVVIICFLTECPDTGVLFRCRRAGGAPVGVCAIDKFLRDLHCVKACGTWRWPLSQRPWLLKSQYAFRGMGLSVARLAVFTAILYAICHWYISVAVCAYRLVRGVWMRRRTHWHQRNQRDEVQYLNWT